MRKIIQSDPFADLPSSPWPEAGRWPADWIGFPNDYRQPFAGSFRLKFTLREQASFCVHVSADERYVLYVNGRQEGRGPQRGDMLHWHFETYEWKLEAGEHVIVALVWALGNAAPYAQISVQPGFLLATEEQWKETLATGFGNWEVRRMDGYSWIDRPGVPFNGFSGLKEYIEGSVFPWGFENGTGKGWCSAPIGAPAVSHYPVDVSPVRLLRPSPLLMLEEEISSCGTIRHVSAICDANTQALPILAKDHLAEEARAWQEWLDGGPGINLAGKRGRRIIIDLNTYLCAYLRLGVSEGRDSLVKLSWAEALYPEYPADIFNSQKGNRNEIEGKYFIGSGDTLVCGGGEQEYQPLWWNAGRYVELVILPAADPITLRRITFLETRCSLAQECQFDTSDSRYQELTRILVRTIQVNSHEHFVDCPHYEQMGYVGDALSESLAAMVLTSDSPLARQSVLNFCNARLPDGFTQSRYPCRQIQVIPGFSLFWILMAYNYALWRGEPEVIRKVLPAAREVAGAWLTGLTEKGVVRNPRGWNFWDWAGWPAGEPPTGPEGYSSLSNCLLVVALDSLARLEEWVGESTFAGWARHQASRVAEATIKMFWVAERGLMADSLLKDSFSEHAQALALIAGHLAPTQTSSMLRALMSPSGLTPATVYFSHYVFEALTLHGKADFIQPRLQKWFDLPGMGLFTVPEQNEPTRSDCHGWGSHPLFHYFASILGIRPRMFGFGQVDIRPCLSELQWVKASLPHPRGKILFEIEKNNGRHKGRIKLPEGTSGTLHIDNGIRFLDGGAEHCFGA